MWRKMSILVLLSAVTINLLAQSRSEDKYNGKEIPSQIQELLIEILEENENANIEEVVEQLEQLLKNPIDINKALKRDLESLYILNDFQIEMILSYRAEHGEFASIYEVMYLNGFDEDLFKLISPFIAVSDNGFYINQAKQKISSYEVISRYKRTLQQQKGYASNAPTYIGSPDYIYLRGSAKIGAISLNITTEKDAGEMFLDSKGLSLPDFVSASAQYESRGVLSKIIVGDYSANFGQGLVLWSGFSMDSPSLSPSKYRKSREGVFSYRSSAEQGFFRGLATEFTFGKYVITTGISYIFEDAKIENGVVKTIYTDGLHRTQARILNKATLPTSVLIFNLSREFNSSKIGFTTVAHKDKYNRPKGNLGLNWYWSKQRVRIFGEAALDSYLKMALIAGGIYNFSGINELAVVYREYSNNYDAIYSNAYSKNTSASSERGVKIAILYKGFKHYPIKFDLDYAFFPYGRYRADNPSYQFELFSEVGPIKTSKVDHIFRVRFSKRFYNVDDKRSLSPHMKYSFRYTTSIVLHPFKIKSAAELNYYSKKREGENSYGFAIMSEASCKLLIDRMTVVARLSLFNAEEWDNRVYFAESDPQGGAFSQPLNGYGYRTYLLSRYKLAKNIDLWIKYSRTHRFGEDKIGEGPEQTLGPSRDELKLQLKLMF